MYLVTPLILILATASPEAETTVAGKDGWLFFAPELRHLETVAKLEHKEAIAAIVDFKRQLDEAGVELLLVPVPAKAAVYPEHVTKGAPGADGTHQAFYMALAKQGVEVLDLAPVFARAKQGSRGRLYCQKDTHWSGEGCVVAARALAQAIERRAWYAAVAKRKLDSERKTVELTGDLVRGRPDAGKEEVLLRAVGARDGERLVPVPPDRASPVLLLGDSHNLVFHAGGDMFAVGAGLPDQLALELGFAVDLLAVRGSGATPARLNLARRVRADAAYLAGKKLVVWCFSVRELTQSNGWQKVSLKPRTGGS